MDKSLEKNTEIRLLYQNTVVRRLYRKRSTKAVHRTKTIGGGVEARNQGTKGIIFLVHKFQTVLNGFAVRADPCLGALALLPDTLPWAALVVGAEASERDLLLAATALAALALEDCGAVACGRCARCPCGCANGK